MAEAIQAERYREYRARYRARKAGRPYVEDLPEGHRHCWKCESVLPIERFPVRGSGRRHVCDTCWAAIRAERDEERRIKRNEWKRANETPEQRKKWNLKKLYGITMEQYEAMLTGQHGRCAICGSTESLVVDHCHESGAVRGILCVRCNSGLGQFLDNIEALRAAALYLEVNGDGSRWI
jgi:hypothetical protein